jgi:hypothetical protein
MLAAYAAQIPIDEVTAFPISYYWELVSQGINKGNLVSGGHFQSRTEASKNKALIDRTAKRIEKMKSEGTWPNPAK